MEVGQGKVGIASGPGVSQGVGVGEPESDLVEDITTVFFKCSNVWLAINANSLNCKFDLEYYQLDKIYFILILITKI